MPYPRPLVGSASALLFLLFSSHPSSGELRIITPASPQPITHVQVSPGLQKVLEKPRGANPPTLIIEGYIDSRGTMTVGLREERVQQGTCTNCASGRVQDWKPDGQGVSHFVDPKGVRLSPVNPVGLVCKQDDRPTRLICELR